MHSPAGSSPNFRPSASPSYGRFPRTTTLFPNGLAPGYPTAKPPYPAPGPSYHQIMVFYNGPQYLPPYQARTQVVKQAPEARDIQKLGEEDAIILVDCRWKTKPENTPIKDVLQKEADDLIRRSQAWEAQECRIDRSTGPLSAEHEHICKDKGVLHSPLHLNTAWSDTSILWMPSKSSSQ